MRLVFWLFLLLNAVFFYWQFTQPEESAPLRVQSASKPAGVANLVLLRERGLGPLVEEPLSTTREVTRANVELVPPKVVLQPSAKTVTSARPENMAEVIASPAEENVKPAPTTKPESNPAPKIILACFMLGPFKDEASAGKMYKALLPLGISIEQRLTKRRIPKNYWVFLPPQKSYADARRKFKKLEAEGLDDMFIMGAGDMKNALSLGLFKRKSMAISRFNEVRVLDSSTVMKPQFRVITEKWLALTVDSAATETVARLAQLADEQPGIEFQQQKSCK